MGFPFREFSAKQREVLATPGDRRIYLLDGPVRSGKTIPATLRWLAYLGSLEPGSKVLMTGKTLGSLRNNVLDDMAAMVGQKNYHFSHSTNIATICGRRIRCVGAHDEGSQDIIKGDTFAGWYADEVTLYPKSFIDQARARCSRDPGMIIWTCNPEGPFHPIHVEFIAKDAPTVVEGLVRRISFSLDDNRALSEEFKRVLWRSFTGVFHARNVLGLWVLAEGIIYDAFDLALHGFDDGQSPTVFDSLRVALDYGTQNPFHALLIGDKDGTSWVIEEWRYCGRDEARQKTDGEYSASLRSWLRGRATEKIVVDPSATSFIVQLRRDRWQGVTPAENDVVHGIRTVANRLAAGKLRIHRSRCPELIKELSTYAWDPKASQHGEDKPLKLNDHGVDALRYDQYTRFGRVHAAFVAITQLRREE